MLASMNIKNFQALDMMVYSQASPYFNSTRMISYDKLRSSQKGTYRYKNYKQGTIVSSGTSNGKSEKTS